MDPFLENIKTYFLEDLKPLSIELDANKLSKALQLCSNPRPWHSGAKKLTDFERNFWKSSTQNSSQNEERERQLEEHEKEFYSELLGKGHPKVEREKLYPDRIQDNFNEELFSSFDKGLWGEEEETLESFREKIEREGNDDEDDEEDEDENEEDEMDEEEGGDDLEIEEEEGGGVSMAKEEKRKYRFESGTGQSSGDVLIKDPTDFLQPVRSSVLPNAPSLEEEKVEEETNIEEYMTQLHQSIFDLAKELDIDYGGFSYLKTKFQDMKLEGAPKVSSDLKCLGTSEESGKTSVATTASKGGPSGIDNRVLKISLVGSKPSPSSQGKKVVGGPKKKKELDEEFLAGFALKKK